MKNLIKKVYRSAVTGEYVSEEFAKANPRETVAETVNGDGSVDIEPVGAEPQKLVLWYPLGQP